jgi:hypothetical protein
MEFGKWRKPGAVKRLTNSRRSGNIRVRAFIGVISRVMNQTQYHYTGNVGERYFAGSKHGEKF